MLEPFSKGWRFVFREPVRKHIGKFGDNLAFPVRGLNNLFQGKWGNAGTETSRFLINTIVGLLGFFDPADSWGLAAPPPEDTGLSFEAAGWEDPNYLVLPVMGPNDTRDTVGLVPDTLMNIGTWFPYVGIFVLLNTGSDLTPQYEKLVETNNEPYMMLHVLISVQRAAELVRFDYTPDPESGEVETLQAAFFAPTDPDFVNRGVTRSVTIPSTGRELPYTLWLQPEPAPVLFVVPGTGSHRLSNHATASAEWAWSAGCSAVTIANSMNFEFYENALSVDLPGYAPVDAHDTHVALDLINKDLEALHAERLQTRGVLGLSLGAMHTLFMAASESDPSNDLMRFDAYISGASPVRLEYAITQLDRFYNAALVLPPEEREEAMMGTLHMALMAGESGDLRPGKPIPIGKLMAEYLIGLSFRFTMMNIIWDTQVRNNMGVLQTELVDDERGPAYAEISEYSFMEYFYAFVLPGYRELNASLTSEEMFRNCSLHSIEAGLVANDKVAVLTNEKDWLQTDEDRAWQRSVFGKRATIWAEGGHMGNTITPEGRAWAIQTISRMLGSTPLESATVSETPEG